jgi:hypothetical protein
MRNGDSSSDTGRLAGIATLLLAWTLATSGNAQAKPPKDSERQAKSDSAAKSVKGMILKVSAIRRYFVDQDNKPFFYLGDTCWLLFQRLNRDEVEEYLKDRASKGFNIIQAYVIRGLDQRHPDGNGSLLGELPFIDRDPTKPNEGFFKNVDFVVNRANELGLVMGLVTMKSWHVNENPEKVFNEKNAYLFGKFLGERYKNNAVIWYPGGDSAPGKDEAVWVAIAKGLKDGSGGTHLVSYHGDGQSSSSTWFHKANWLDFNSIQLGHGWAAKTYRFIDKDYALKPAKPTVDMEPPYENHPTGAKTPRIDSHQVRKGAYWNLLAGAAGHGYGALDLFWLYKDSDRPFPKNGFQHWRKAMAYEGSRQMRYLRQLFELRPWYKLVPDQSVISAGQGEGEDLVRAARAEDGSFVIAYLPTGKPISIKMDKPSGKTVKAQWYDPRKGTWQKIGEYTNTGSHAFTAPTHGEKADWVLVLEDAAKDLPIARSMTTPEVIGPIIKDSFVRVGESPAAWNPEKAGESLDGRVKLWFRSAECISCHTALPYALARPALRKLVGATPPTEQETKLLAHVKKRVTNWKDLDTKEFGLYYDANDELKKQSWGTEAVFNALILAFDDRSEGRSSPSESTKQAFVNLWQTQVQSGNNKGAWEWLDFNEAPWGNSESPYFGASLAAIAVGTAPGYASTADTDVQAKIALLRGYLKSQLEGQNLHNRIWGLWASTQLEGILTKAEQKKIIDRLFDKQQDDGGWSLPTLGTWVRHDRTKQEPSSDAYATALILHVVQLAGVPKKHAKVAMGLDWLKRNQSATGAWRSVSVVKKRDPASHAGQFMSDAATAYTVLALDH